MNRQRGTGLPCKRNFSGKAGWVEGAKADRGVKGGTQYKTKKRIGPRGVTVRGLLKKKLKKS